MPKLNTTVSELLIYNPDSSEGFAETFVFEPEEKEEEPYGRLMVLVSFDEKSPKTAEISEAIASIMQNEYYRPSERNPEQQFEYAIKRVNDILGDLASAGEISWIGKLNSVITAIVGEEILLTSSGQAFAYLVRHQQLAHLNKESSSVPLKPNPLKTYENIINGQLNPDDKFVFLSPSILDYIEKPKIKEIIDRFTPDIAARHLQSKLVSFQEKKAMAALIVSTVDPAKAVTAPAAPLPNIAVKAAAPAASPTSPAPRSTTPGALARTTRILRSLAAKTASGTKNKILPFLKGKKIATSNQPSHSSGPSATASAGPRRAGASAPSLQEPLTSRKPYTYTDLRRKPWWKKILLAIENLGKMMWRSFAAWFHRLPKTSKLLFIIVVALVIAFLISLAAVQGGKQSQEQRAIYNNQTTAAGQKEQDAQAALIYGNDAKARQLLDEAQSLAQEVQTTKYRNDEAAAVLSQVEKDRQRLNHITMVDSPETVADFSTLGEGVKPQGLVLAGKYLAAYNPDQPSLYTYQLSDKKYEAVEIKTSGKLTAAGSSDTDIALFSNTPDLIDYKIGTTSATEAGLGLPADTRVNAMKVFGNRLYALDPGHSQIQQFSFTVGGFSKPSNWLAESADLSQGVDLAIDGTVYVLTGDGRVLKFLRGISQDFTLGEMTTPLNNPTTIATSDSSSNLYILDPQNKRVVVLDKDGVLKNQYISDTFTDLRGMAIDEANSKAYLLNGTKVLGIMLSSS